MSSSEINCISMSNEFGAKALCSLVERRVKIKNPFSTSFEEEVKNENLEFHKTSFLEAG